MSHAPDSFGVRLMKAQNRAKIHNSELARMINVNRATIAHLRLDERGLSVGLLTRLCDALSCSADYLLGLSDDPQVRGA